jgi:hypothetical protein
MWRESLSYNKITASESPLMLGDCLTFDLLLMKHYAVDK